MLPCFWTSRLCEVPSAVCVEHVAVSWAVMCALSNRKIWIHMAEPWTSVIFSPWKIKNCSWKVLEFWFDKAVWTLWKYWTSCTVKEWSVAGWSVGGRYHRLAHKVDRERWILARNFINTIYFKLSGIWLMPLHQRNKILL